LYPFKPFYKDWLNCSQLFLPTINEIRYTTTNLNINFFSSLSFDESSLKQYRIEAALHCAETLGEKPALTLSGGIDSQCMVQAFKDADLKFDVYTLVFKNNLNKQDVDSARNYCNTLGIKLNEIELDVVSFLTRENYEYGLKYKSASPQFNTHYKMYDIIADMGYSGVCSGGNYIRRNKNTYGINFKRNELNFINYSLVSGFPCQGSFLNFYPNLSWALCLLTQDYDLEFEILNKSPKYFNESDKSKIEKNVYQNKLISYRKAGFNIIPQDKKYTGFEFVKKYFEKLTGDGWTFEKRFRSPLEQLYKPPNNTELLLDETIKETIESIYRKNSTSSYDPSSGIRI